MSSQIVAAQSAVQGVPTGEIYYEIKRTYTNKVHLVLEYKTMHLYLKFIFIFPLKHAFFTYKCMHFKIR